MEIVKFYHKHNAELFSIDILKNAAKNNNFKCFKYMIDQKIFKNYDIIVDVIQSKNVEMLKYLIDHGLNVEVYIQKSAPIIIKYGTCDMLKLIHKRYINFSPSQGLSEKNFADAVMFNNLEMIKYLCQCQCPVPDNVYSLAISKMTDKGVDILDKIINRYSKSMPSRFNDDYAPLNLLKFLFSKGYKCQENAYIEALEFYDDRSECLELLLDNKIKWNSEVCNLAAYTEKYLLRMLHEIDNTIKWTFDGYIQAIKNMNHESLEYMMLNDAKDKVTYTQRQVDKLYKTLAKYSTSSQNKADKIFKLLNENFKMSGNVYQYAIKYARPKMLNYALKHDVKPIKLYYNKIMIQEYYDDEITNMSNWKKSMLKQAYGLGFMFDRKLYEYFHCYIEKLH